MPLLSIVEKIRRLFMSRSQKTGVGTKNLRLVQLEDRRMLNATFVFDGVAALDLAGFDTTGGTNQIAVNDTGTALEFTLNGGTWSADVGNVADAGITGAGTGTLSVAKSVFEDAGDQLALTIDAQIAGASNVNFVLNNSIVLPDSPTDGAFAITSDGAVTLGFTVDGAGNDFAVDTTGAISQTAALSNIGNLDYDAGTTIGISASIATDGTVDVDSTGLTTIGATGDITAGGAVTFGTAKAGFLTTSGDIDTTDDNITFSRAVTLGGNVDFDTTGTAAGNIHFASTVATVGNNLTLDAGAAGNIDLDAAATGGGDFVVRDGAVQNYSVLTLDSVDILDATTSVTFNGTVTVTANNANGGLAAFKVNTPGLVTIGGTLTATSTAALNVDIDPTNVNVNNDILATGQIDLTASNDISIGAFTVRADTDGDGGTLNITADDDASGAGNISAVNGSILRGHTVNLFGFDITTDVVVSDVGNLAIQAANEVTLNDATTATAAQVLVTATSNDVNLTGAITAGTNTTITAGGAIVDGNAGALNITAGTATLSATAGIGSGNAIETNITQLEATNTTTGTIEITELAAGVDIALGAVSNGTRDVLITADAGAITDGNAGALNITAGTATLSAMAGIGSGNAIETNITQLEATNTTTGTIEITELAAGVDIALGAVSNGTRDVLITAAAGAITDGNAGALNITAGTATLSATAGIGSGNAIETNITALRAANTTAGTIEITELAAGGDITLLSVSNPTRDIIITANGSIFDGNDSLLTANAAAAQNQIVVANPAQYAFGDTVVVVDNDSPPETFTVAAIAGNTLTLSGNLVNAFTLAQNARVLGTNVIANNATLTSTNGSIGATSTDVFKGIFNPIEVALTGNLTASAVTGAVAVGGTVAGTTSMTAITGYLESSADLNVAGTTFTVQNLALIAAGRIIIADGGFAYSGLNDLRVQASDVDAVTAGNPVQLGSAAFRVDRLLYNVTNAADERVIVFTNQLDVRTSSNIQIEVSGNTQFTDLNCDLTSFDTTNNTGVIVAIGGTITQGTQTGLTPGSTLNDKLLSQNLLLLGNGTICLDHRDNDVNTIAGQLVGTASIYFNDIDDLAVGTVSSLYAVPAPAFPVQAYNGLQTANGDVHVRAGGNLNINQIVSAGTAGRVLLATTGATSDVFVNAAISGGTGHITLNAGRDIDLNFAATTGGAGTVDMLAGRDISIDATLTTADGDIFINAANSITQTALVTTTNGDVGLRTTIGDIVQTATGDITTTTGDGLVDAGGNWTMADGTAISAGGQDFVGRAGGTITLGQISMTNASANRVALQAVAGDITDINGAAVNIEETVAAATTSLSLRAGGRIGAADAANGTPLVNVNAIDLNVDSVAAAASTGIYLREIAAGGAITVNEVPAVTVNVNAVQRIDFKTIGVNVNATQTLAALEDLRTTTNGPIKLVAENGTITVNGGTNTAAVGVAANGTGDILLEARGAASDVVVNAGVSSGSGHITLNAGDDIDLNASLTTGGAGSAFLSAANGTADAADTISIDGSITTANGDILIRSQGNITQTAAINTTGGNVGLVAGANITQTATGDVTSTNGDVLVDAGGSWTMANGTVISAGGQDFVGRAGGTITLGQISMTNATTNRVALQAAAGDISDANGATVNMEETVAAATTSVSLRASGMIGAADAGNGTPPVNVNAIDLNVDSVAAVATTGIYLREIAAGGAIVVRDVPAVTVNIGGAEQVNFNSTRTPVAAVTTTLAVLEDLTNGPPGGPIKLVAENGTITIEGGTVTPAVGVVAANAGDILLEARGAASDVIVNASIASGTGYITLNAGRDIDLNSTATTGGSGTAYMLAGRNANVDATVTTADGDILVRATGNITQTALMTSTNGDIGLVSTAGDITQTATGDVTTTNGDVLVDAGGNWTMANGTVISAGGQDFVGRAGGTITLGQISMTNASANRVALQAVAGDITDINGAAVNIEETVAAATTSLNLRAGGMIGAADAANGTPLVNVNAIDLNVDSVAAAASTGIYLREIAAGGSIVIRDVPAVTVTIDGVQQVNFNSTRTPFAGVTRTLGSLEDMRTAPPGGPIKLVAENGTITVEGGIATPAVGVVASNAGDILLEARGAASDVIVNGSIAGTTRHITLSAGDDVDLNANISTGGPGAIYVLATNATADAISGIDMQSGTSVTTGGGNVRMVADNEGNILLGLINAGSGDVSLIAEQSILDNNGSALNVQADALRMVADAAVTNAANQVGIIGGSDILNGTPNSNVNAIDTAVTTLAAQSADGIYIRESDGLTVDFTGDITVQQVNFNSTTTARTDLSLSDLTTTDSSPIKLQSVIGSLVLNEGDADNQTVSANGTGDILLQTIAADGDITTNSRVLSGTGHITLNAGGNIDLNGVLTTNGLGTAYLVANNISIDAPITTDSGDILVQARAGNITQTAAITTDGDVGLVATGNITQTATGDVTTTNGDVLVDAGGNWTMANGTVISAGGQDFVGRAGSTITLGHISMTNAAANRVALEAVSGDMLDGNAATVNIEETMAGAVTSLSLRAGGSIGASGGVPSLNGNAVDLNVDTVAARAAAGIYLSEITAGGDLTIDTVTAVTVNVEVQQVNFNSTLTAVPQSGTLGLLEDLTTTADAGEIQVVVQAGILTVNRGPGDTAGVTASGNNSRIHMEATGDVNIKANITAGTNGITAVDIDLTTPGEEIVIRSVSGSLIVGLGDPVTISTDENTVAGNSTSGTSDQIHLLTGPYSQLSVNAPAGQNQVTLNSVAGFAVGDVVAIDDGDSDPQVLKITAIAGNTLTLNGNLTSAYSTAQNAFVERISGLVRFGADVTLRTDGGVANHFYDRVLPGGPGTSFFTWNGVPLVSTVARSGTDFIVTFHVTINSAGEENQHMEIDWRDPTQPRAKTLIDFSPPDFTGFPLPTLPRVYAVSHTYSFAAFKAFVDAGNPTFNVDFSVSHNSSIQVFGGTVQQGGGLVITVPGHVLTTTDDPTTGTGTAILPAQVTDDVLSDTDFHFEDGLVEVKIPTLFLPPIVPDLPQPAPPAPPVAVQNLVVPPLVLVSAVEVPETPFSSYSTQSEDYFQLREFDGVTRKVVEKYEHIADEFGELLLQPAQLKQWVTREHFQDRVGLELWLITEKHTRNGPVTVERPVLKFDIANGQPFPAKEVMPTEFQELKLIPMPLDDNFNDPSLDESDGAETPIGDPSASMDDNLEGKESNDPNTGSQSRVFPLRAEDGTVEMNNEVHSTFSSSPVRSMLTTIAVAAVLNQNRISTAAPSKSRQLLNRILNRQRKGDNL